MSHGGQVGVYFDSGGYRLLGTLFLAAGDDPKPTAIILHGIPGVEKNYDIALFLRERGWNSLIFHYRGNWGSEGVYNFKTIPGDVSAALDYLCSGAHPQVKTDSFVVLGHSLGSWAAILCAEKDQRISAVAVYGAVCDPRQFTWTEDILEQEFTPWLPGFSNEMFLDQWAELDAEYSPVEQVEKLAPRPLLIIHGENDDVIPFFQADELNRRANPTSTQYITHPNANHSFTWHRGWLLWVLWAWLEQRRV